MDRSAEQFIQRRSLLTGFAAAGLAGFVPRAFAQAKFINVLTGGQSGVYYPMGVALSQIYGTALPGARVTVQATKAGATYEVGATIYGVHPRIVKLNGHNLEASPEGILLIIENQDRPGMVGSIGTLLAKHKINIGSMSLSRGNQGGNALSVYNLDSTPADETIKAIEAEAGILSVRVAKL